MRFKTLTWLLRLFFNALEGFVKNWERTTANDFD